MLVPNSLTTARGRCICAKAKPSRRSKDDLLKYTKCNERTEAKNWNFSTWSKKICGSRPLPYHRHCFWQKKKNTYNRKTTASYPGLNYFSSEPVQGVQMVGSIVFPSSVFRPHTTTWTPGKGYFSVFLYYKTTRLFVACEQAFCLRKGWNPFPSLSSRFFHSFPKQRACSQAKTFAPSNSQANLVSSPSFVFKVIKRVYMWGTDNFFPLLKIWLSLSYRV